MENDREFNEFLEGGFHWLASGGVASRTGFPGFRKRIQRGPIVIPQAFDNDTLL